MILFFIFVNITSTNIEIPMFEFPYFYIVKLFSGAVMEDLAHRLLHLRKTSFVPKHKNNLANEFSCYSNFDFEIL